MYILTRGATHSKFWWGYIIEQKKKKETTHTPNYLVTQPGNRICKMWRGRKEGSVNEL